MHEAATSSLGADVLVFAAATGDLSVCAHSLQKMWPAVAVVHSVLARASARVIVCGTALALELHSRRASAVGKVSVGYGVVDSVAAGHHLRAWSQASASQYLKNFIIPRDGGAGHAAGDLDISDVPGLFPCACGLRTCVCACVCCVASVATTCQGCLFCFPLQSAVDVDKGLVLCFGRCWLHVCTVHCHAGRPRLMALYVLMLTRPAFAALGKAERVEILRTVILGKGKDVPRELRLGNGSSVLRRGWLEWVSRSSLIGTLKQLQPTQFADVVLCLLSCAGLQVVVGEPSHDVVTTGLAYVTLVPQGADAPPKGHATFVEVGAPFVHEVVAPSCVE